jgi:hypothetical protein
MKLHKSRKQQGKDMENKNKRDSATQFNLGRHVDQIPNFGEQPFE